MPNGVLDRGLYARYAIGVTAVAVLALITGARWPWVGLWAEAHPVAFGLAVAAGYAVGVALPPLAILAALSALGVAARRAAARIGEGDFAEAEKNLRRIARWTPRLRWAMLSPAHVASMRRLADSLAQLGPPAPGAPATTGCARPGASRPGFVVVRQDETGRRVEIARAVTREEAERQRDIVARIAKGRAAAYRVEELEAGAP
jgi:hypothetical protein